MINFAQLRTRRLSVRLKEIGMKDSILLLAVPHDRHEAMTTQFLERVIDSADTPSSKHIADPRMWTVQERMLVVGHYLSHVSSTGADFEMEGGGKYSDYLLGDDINEFPIEAGSVGDDDWYISPLLGIAAEAIEDLEGEVDDVTGRFHWIRGRMAAQMTLKGEVTPDPIENYADYVEWLKSRIQVLSEFPESAFVQLLSLFMAGEEKLRHFFKIEANVQGIVAMPNTQKEAEGMALPPVRFPVHSCLSDFAKGVAGKLGANGS